MKQPVLIGQTDYTVLVKIRDDAGAAKTGLTEASIDIAYARVETDNDVTTADVTPAALAALTDAHTDWGFEEVSATDHPGLYRLDIADAVFASGAWSAVVTIVGTGLDPADLEFILVAVDPKAATAPANYIAATSIASDAITAAKIANGAIDAATFAADVDAEVLSYVVDDATRIDASALNTAAVTSIPAILVDTADIQPKIGTPVTDLAADIAVVEGQTDDIGAAGAGLTAITAKTGNLPADPADQSAVEAKIDTIKSRVI